MSKNNVRNFRKIPSKVKESCIKFIGRFNHQYYMKHYLPYLKRKGMNISGEPIYIAVSVSFDGEDYSLVHLGDKTVISSDVRFLTHDYSISRALQAIGENVEKEVYFTRAIRVGSNCFIGNKALLLPGTTLGDNVIVGAGSVVRGTFPDNVMLVGNPAVVIGDTLEWAKKKKKECTYVSNKN